MNSQEKEEAEAEEEGKKFKTTNGQFLFDVVLFFSIVNALSESIA